MNDMPSQPPRPMQPMQPPQPMQANQQITATLEAQEWNVIFGALNELPMRIARPVFDKLMSQLNQLPR
jgi:hypothetical protein